MQIALPPGGTRLDCKTPVVPLTATSSVAGSSFAWSNGVTLPLLIITNTAGNFTVTGTTPGGCSASASIAVTKLEAQTESLAAQVCSGLTYFFNNQNLAVAGSFRDTIFSKNGCDSVFLVLDLTFAPPIFKNLDTTICTGDSIFFDGKYFKTTGTATANLKTPGGCDSVVVLNLEVLQKIETTLDRKICAGDSVVLGGQTFKNTGNFAVIFTAAGGCDSVVNLNLSFFPTISTAISTQNASQGQPDGSATVNLTSGQAPFSLDWGAGDSTGVNLGTLQISHLLAKNYSLTVTDANGCTEVLPFQILENTSGCTLLAPLPTATDATCPGVADGSISMPDPTGGTAPFGFLWSGANGFSSTDREPKNLPPGSYSCLITDTVGCTTNVTATVGQGIAPTVDISPSLPNLQINCAEPTLVLTANVSNDSSFVWSDGTNGAVFGVSAAGDFSVTATDDRGCTGSASVSVSDDFTPPADVKIVLPPAPQITCTSSSTTLLGSSTTAGSTFFWSGAGGFSPTDSSISVNVAGVFSLTVTAPNGCTADTTAIVERDADVPTVEIETPDGTVLDCQKTGLNLLASGSVAATFKWSNGATGASILVGNAGSFSVTLTTASGCSTTENIEITQLEARRDSVKLDTCEGNFVEFFGKKYGTTGIFLDTLRTAGGCDTLIFKLNLLVKPLPSVHITTKPGSVLTCRDPQIQLLASASPGSILLWKNGSTSTDIFVNLPDDWWVRATLDGCEKFAETQILENKEKPDVSVKAVPEAILCSGQTSVLTASATGTNPQFFWEKDSTMGDTLVVNSAGAYRITATDSGNGCSEVGFGNLGQAVPKIEKLIETVCAGECFEFGGIQRCTSGTFQNTLKSVLGGCDSVYQTLILTVLPVADGFDKTWICAGETVLFCGVPIDSAGDFECTLQTAAGCDSLVKMRVELRQPPEFETENDSTVLPLGAGFFAVNLLENDDFDVAETWATTVLAQPTSGMASFSDLENVRFALIDGGYLGYDSLEYLLCWEVCPAVCDTGRLRFFVQNDDLKKIQKEYFTNVLTPDDDGKNEAFFPVLILEENGVQVESAKLTIFSRWGDRVHFSEGENPSWDGKSGNGQAVPEGAYFYVLEGKLVGGRFVLKGDVSVLR